MRKPTTPGKGWRFLRPHEVVKEGDQFWLDITGWDDCTDSIGMSASSFLLEKSVRRRTMKKAKKPKKHKTPEIQVIMAKKKFIIEVGKSYVTRSGARAQIHFIISKPQGYSDYFAGEILVNDVWCASSWKHSGRVFNDRDDGYDIVGPWVEKLEWCKENPGWAQWQAHDDDGTCYWFTTRPTYNEESNWWSGPGYADTIPDSHAPKLPAGMHARDSLVKRPKK